MEEYRDKLNNDNFGSVSHCHMGQRGLGLQYCAEVIEIEVENIRGAYGPVQGGYIQLKCESLIHWPLGEMIMDQPSAIDFRTMHSLGFCSMEEDLSEAEGTLYLLRIKMNLNTSEDSLEAVDFQYCCLIVEAVSGGQGMYRRIGLAQIYEGYVDCLEGKEENKPNRTRRSTVVLRDERAEQIWQFT